ncbi:MAG TPA: hypothetical protein VGF86_00965 [Candidatus Tumulicola sp.]|jgi:hypothetical protein
MEHAGERGSSLVEAAVAIAIVALLAGGAISAALGVLHAAAGLPIRDALQTAVRREMPIAFDVLKYRDAKIVPTSVATTLPMPAGSPLPAQLSVRVSRAGATSVRIAIDAVATETGERATLTAVLGERAPLPGSKVRAPGLAPAPTGAP